MSLHRVIWAIDIFDAASHREAAEKALKIHRNPESIATVFDVTDEAGQTVQVDLTEDTENTLIGGVIQ